MDLSIISVIIAASALIINVAAVGTLLKKNVLLHKCVVEYRRRWISTWVEKEQLKEGIDFYERELWTSSLEKEKSPEREKINQ